MYLLMYKPKYNFFWPNKSKNTEAIIKSDDACILFCGSIFLSTHVQRLVQVSGGGDALPQQEQL